MKETPPINIHYHANDVCMDLDDVIYDALKPLGYKWSHSGYEFDCGLRNITFAVPE